MVDNILSLLVSIIDDIADTKDVRELFFNIFSRLQVIYDIPLCGFAIFDNSKNNIVLVVAEIHQGGKRESSNLWLAKKPVSEFPFDVKPVESISKSVGKEFFYNLEHIDDNRILIKSIIEKSGINSFSFLPMMTAGEFMGYLILSSKVNTLENYKVDYSLKIANIVGSVLRKAYDYMELQKKELEKGVQIELLSKIVGIKDPNSFYTNLYEGVEKLIPNNYFSLSVNNREGNIQKMFSLIKDEKNKYMLLSPQQSIAASIFSANVKIGSNDFSIDCEEFKNEKLHALCKKFPNLNRFKEKNNINSFLRVSYYHEKQGGITLVLGRKNEFYKCGNNNKIESLFLADDSSYFSDREIDLTRHILPPLGLILASFHLFEEVKRLSNKLEQEKNYLLDEINLTNSFQEIIGKSVTIKNVLNKIEQVAPLDATVLILGETGTGKELIARAIHNLSKRKDNAFITVNCAALPLQLIESELFGHEKGSFTGAIEKRIGKFEVADGGTIFLDEIGELPLEIQSKLLRVLQEKEFERVGGKSTVFSDVRIIAATNRNLEKEIAAGRFRADLFFRLNVFPIISPPLKERIEDIPLLVKHFAERYSKRIGKDVKSISKNDMDMLMQYNWPGNIRELEHMIERAIIISEGASLNVENLLGSTQSKTKPDLNSFKTLVELEKEHIVNALKVTNGKVTGENSAAQLLGINGKTLGSRMRKLGIKREIKISV